MRRTVVFLVVLSMALFGSNASALAQNPPSNASSTTFSDVPADHWAYEEILALHQRGVITGHGDGTFGPDAVVLRSEFAKMMVLALDLSLADAASPTFLDVPTDSWACQYVETARIYLTGFRTSHGDYFKPLDAAVREDMAVALVNALGYASEAEDEEPLKGFADQTDISPNLRKHVAMAVRKGVMEGYPDYGNGRTFKPMGSLTRAETAALLYKLVGAAGEVKVTYDSTAGQLGGGTGQGSTADRPAPEVTATVSGGRILVTWKAIESARFQGYKVVISRNDPSPTYPEDGYLCYITENIVTSAVVDNIQNYNGGDFGGQLLPGAAYYFSVTALYDDCKVAGNAVRLVYPGP